MFRRHPLLSRRVIVRGLASFGAIAPARAPHAQLLDEWAAYKARFLSEDGRIVDNGSGGVSHTEGQGWGLLFAVAAQDRPSFDLISGWTARTLRRPSDALHAWRYVPRDRPPVRDLNNAVDGDLFIATALCRAARLWGRPDHLRAAIAIGRDILRLLVRRVGPFTILLPGTEGFETKDAIIVNPSYYAFPMMTELAAIVPSPQWDRLQRDGGTLIERGRFGRWALPPDWLRISKANAALSPAPGWPPRFSYDAIRVPLWWTWQGLPTGPAIQSIREFWSPPPPNVAPAWVNLATNEVASYPATPGMTAIMRLMQLAGGGPAESHPGSVVDTNNYYDAALIMLSRIAEQEMISH
jgi:endo-1,4-beta-D-glucanase Y